MRPYAQMNSLLIDRNHTHEWVTQSAEETEALGQALAGQLHAGDVVGLYGDLGAGKTCFVRGVASAFQVRGPVTSPTFTLVNEYSGRIPLFHFDLYRLNHALELEDLGVDDYLYAEGISLLEWAEKGERLLPRTHWRVLFQIVDDRTRRIRISPPSQP